MFKTVVLKLVNIKYSGDSIGNDIRVEISALNNFISVDKKVKRRKSVACDEIVGQFFVSDEHFNPEIKITVIEKDLISNDVGGITAKIKINLENSESQISAHKVEVRESRGKKRGKRCGMFEIALEATASPVFGYVPETKDGWLRVEIQNKKIISIPSFLKVRIDRRNDGREYFIILEGVLRGQKASVKSRPDGRSFLLNDNPHTAAVRATYSIFEKILSLNGKRYPTTDYTGAPWLKGLYDIEIPDTPHQGGLRYVSTAKNPTVWFRVGHSGERYIHTGSHSLGCITVVDQERWGAIYDALIKARKGDSASVGVLEVIG